MLRPTAKDFGINGYAFSCAAVNINLLFDA
jgi:hypothetical protein